MKHKIKHDKDHHEKGHMEEMPHAMMKKKRKHKKSKHKKKAAGSGKVEKVMHEFKEHTLHSGSKKGPVVTSKPQALAIALSEKRRANKK